MKTLLLVLAMAGMSMFAHANPFVKVPVRIKTAFSAEFKDVEKTKWFQVKSVFGVEFKKDGKIAYAFFNRNGKMLETDREISFHDLSPEVQKEIDVNYGDCYVQTVFKFSGKEGESYLIRLKNVNTLREFELLFE